MFGCVVWIRGVLYVEAVNPRDIEGECPLVRANLIRRKLYKPYEYSHEYVARVVG